MKYTTTPALNFTLDFGFILLIWVNINLYGSYYLIKYFRHSPVRQLLPIRAWEHNKEKLLLLCPIPGEYEMF